MFPRAAVPTAPPVAMPMPSAERNGNDDALLKSVADARHRAHQPGLDPVDGVVADVGPAARSSSIAITMP